MSDTEQRLAELLKTAAPEPPSEMTMARLRAARDGALSTTVAAPQRPVRRWVPLIAAAAVAACVAGIVGGIALSRNDHATTPAASSNPSPSVTGTGVAASTPCPASSLSGLVVGHDQAMSHNLQIVDVRNSGSTGCYLQGYPALTLLGASGAISAVVTDGPTYLQTDPGPKRIDLAPGAVASFGVEASTGYDGPARTITSLKIGFDSGPSLSIPANLTATVEAGSPIAVGVTAYQLVNSTATFSPTGATSTPSANQPTNPPATSSTAPSTTPCDLGQLAVTVGRVDSGAGQRNLPVTLTNTLGPTCTVTGFPQNLTAYTSTTAASGSQVSITASKSTGTASTISLAKGASASFVFHCTIGYPTTEVTIVLLRFQLAGSPGQVSMEINNGGISANGPSGQPIPVDVTALQPGTGG